jgi:hypothetical protein
VCALHLVQAGQLDLDAPVHRRGRRHRPGRRAGGRAARLTGAPARQLT